MTNLKQLPNRNQEQNKENKFNRAQPFQYVVLDGRLTANSDFQKDPLAVFNGLTSSQQKFIKLAVYFMVNQMDMNCSHRYISSKIGVHEKHVWRFLEKLKEAGIVSSFYSHMKPCFYLLSTAFLSSKVVLALKGAIPTLTCLLSASMLLSSGFLSSQSEYVEQDTKNNKLRSSLRNERTVSRSSDKIFSQNCLIRGEISGEAWIATPQLSQNEMTKDLCRLEKLYENFKPLGDAKLSIPTDTLLEEKILKKEFVKMENMDKLSPEQQEKFKETAMHKLLPKSAHYFNSIPLTLVGKLNLALYSNSAIEYAKKNFNKKLHASIAYDDFCSHAHKFCIQNGTGINYEAASLLFKLYGVNQESPKTKDKPRRTECKEFIPKPTEQSPNLIYADYFYFEENKNKDFPLANPHKGNYNEFLESAAEATGQDKRTLHQQFKQMYFSKDHSKEVHTQRETDSTQANSHDNLPRTSRLRLPEATQSGITVGSTNATRLL